MRRCLSLLLFVLAPLLFGETVIVVEAYRTDESALPAVIATRIAGEIAERLESTGSLRGLTAREGSDAGATDPDFRFSLRYASHTLRETASGPALRLVTDVEIIPRKVSRLPYRFQLATIGFGTTPYEAWGAAAAEIPDALLAEIERTDILPLGGGIVAVDGRRLLLDMGGGMGLYRGMELLIGRGEGGIDEFSYGSEQGMIRVTEVRRGVSFAELVYGSADGTASLVDPGWAGFESVLYARTVLTFDGEAVPIVGTRTLLRRGLRSLRPSLGLEIPVASSVYGPGLPLFPYFGIGTEMAWGRFQLTPGGALGIGVRSPVDSAGAALTHYGGTVDLQLSWLFRRDLRIGVAAGYAYWTGTDEIPERLRYDYNGVMLEVGILRKW